MRVLTLNCWNVTQPFAPRMTVLRAALAALAPDVLGLQEIVVRQDGFDQARVILEGLGYGHVFGPAFRWTRASSLLPFDHPGGDAFGNVVASRWPIRRGVVRPLPGAETGERRSVLAALVETPAGTLAFLTTHLNWKHDQGHVRERQVVALADTVAELQTESVLPPILVGDLNADPQSTEIRFLCGNTSLKARSPHFQDAWHVAGDGTPGFTWDNRNRFAAYGPDPDRRIDYILVAPPDPTGRGRIEAVRLAFTEPTGDVYASDHFGVVADITL